MSDKNEAEAEVVAEVPARTAARILRLSTRTIGQMCAEGKLRARRIGERGWWRIDYASVVDVSNQREGEQQ